MGKLRREKCGREPQERNRKYEKGTQKMKQRKDNQGKKQYE